MSDTAKKSAAKKTAAKKPEEQPASGSQEGSEQEQGSEEQAQPHTGRPGDSGPGTGTPAPEETTARYPAGLADDSAPLDPPKDAYTQNLPEAGYAASSTDPVYASTGGQTIAGEQFSRLVDEDGNDLSADDLFEEGDGTKTVVTTKHRVYEVFRYPNTHEDAKRLVFTKGRTVRRADAERIKASVKAASEVSGQPVTSGEVRGDSGNRGLVD